MDELNASSASDTDSQIPLRLSSFGVKDRHSFGQNIRLAMACIEGTAEPVNCKAMPSDEDAIRQRLKSLSQDMTSYNADLIELLVRFDDLQGWKSSGAKHCAAWVNLEMGISMQLGWEYLRVGRRMRTLPTSNALFRGGKLSWSKIRLIANVADSENEKTLCHAALDASVNDVKRLCNEFRWRNDENDSGENERAFKQWESRSFVWDEMSNGNTRIQVTFPPEMAQAFLNSIEHSLNQLDDSNHKISQRRADAALLMAETSLQAAGREIATADRYQVIVSVDAAELAVPESENRVGAVFTPDDETIFNTENAANSVHIPKAETLSHNAKHIPAKRPTIRGAGVIARETARRIACDCSLTINTVINEEPTDIGRKSRLWPNAMSRAIKERDQHCQFAGCDQTQRLQIHHIKHWADGGNTSIDNGVCLCQFHHTVVHEGGYAIQRIDASEQCLYEQFEHQLHVDDIGMFSFEQELRIDRNSFNQVRKLSPSRYRFRVVDAQGQDIRSGQEIRYGQDMLDGRGIGTGESRNMHRGGTQYSAGTSGHSTRVECREPESGVYLVC